MADSLIVPFFGVARVLLPGAELSLTIAESADGAGLRSGAQVATALLVDGGSDRLPEIGTLAVVTTVHTVAEGHTMLRLRGRRRVRIVRLLEDGSSKQAQISMDDEERPPDGGADRAVAAANTALRRYLATLAESGESASVDVHLPPHPAGASYAVLSLLRISGPEVQDLYAVEPALERLRRLVGVLERETELLRRTIGGRGA